MMRFKMKDPPEKNDTAKRFENVDLANVILSSIFVKERCPTLLTRP